MEGKGTYDDECIAVLGHATRRVGGAWPRGVAGGGREGGEGGGEALWPGIVAVQDGAALRRLAHAGLGDLEFEHDPGLVLPRGPALDSAEVLRGVGDHGGSAAVGGVDAEAKLGNALVDPRHLACDAARDPPVLAERFRERRLRAQLAEHQGEGRVRLGRGRCDTARRVPPAVRKGGP